MLINGWLSQQEFAHFCLKRAKLLHLAMLGSTETSSQYVLPESIYKKVTQWKQPEKCARRRKVRGSLPRRALHLMLVNQTKTCIHLVRGYGISERGCLTLNCLCKLLNSKTED